MSYYAINLGVGCIWADTNRIEQHCKKQLSSTNALVKLLRASWIIFVEDGVCEKPTRLPGENLIQKSQTQLTSQITLIERRPIILLTFLNSEYLIEIFKTVLVI